MSVDELLNSTAFREAVKNIVEEVLAEVKIDVLKQTLVTKDDFKEETTKIWQSIQEMANSIKNMSISIMRIENKEGVDLENAVLDLMRETLQLEDIDPSKLRKEPLYDPEGLVFYRGYTTDIDVLAENGNVYLVEVEATAGTEDIAHFLQNTRLYEVTTEKTPNQIMIAALRISRSALTLAEQLDVRVISGEVLD